jgi:hypothetical protein
MRGAQIVRRRCEGDGGRSGGRKGWRGQRSESAMLERSCVGQELEVARCGSWMSWRRRWRVRVKVDGWMEGVKGGEDDAW